jgi:hypothetical protein
VRGLAFLLLVLAIASSTAGLFGITYSFFEDQGFLVPSIALVVVPWAIWVPVRRLTTAQGKAAFETALATIEPDVANWYDGCGLALDRTNSKLLLGSRREVIAYPLADLSEVEFVPESAGSVSAAGMSNMGVFGAILALFAIGSATAGHLGGGLFLTLAGRKWQISGIGRDDAEPWIAALKAVAPRARYKEPQ